MDLYQVITFIILAVYYTAYFAKLIGQKRKGIKTVQLGVGKKKKRTIVVEKISYNLLVWIVITEVGSILYGAWCRVPSGIRIAGMIFAAFGTVIFIISMVTMQDSWRAGIPATDKTKLVTTGIYKISRNPAFLGFDMVFLGMMMVFFNPVLAFISLLGMVAIHFQILEEEKFLLSTFGESYEEYRKKTRRYL